MLQPAKKSCPDVKAMMAAHYSQPKGFVGRQLIYKIVHNGKCYGAIAAGSATKHLPGRASVTQAPLNNIINNTFFHVVGPYPCRNFVKKVLAEFREVAAVDWWWRYGDKVLAFETLVELPRTGECYVRDGWVKVGQTKGFTCKRTGGKGTDSWSGKRVWDTQNLRPKLVFVRLP